MLDYLTHRNDLCVSDTDLAEIRRRLDDKDAKRMTLNEYNARMRRMGGQDGARKN